MDSSTTHTAIKAWKDQVVLARSQLSTEVVKDFFVLPSDSIDSKNLHSTLERFILLRVVILSIFLIANGWSEITAPGLHLAGPIVFGAIALTYALSLLNAYLLRRTSNLENFAYAQFILDIFLASVASYVATSFTVISLYLLIIVAAAFVIGRHGTVIIAAAAGLAYSLIATELILPRPKHLQGATSEDILVVYGALVVVAVLSSYIAKRLELARNALLEQQRSFSELHQQQRQLIDGISEGVITLDLEKTITGINEAARAIMGLAEIDASQLIGKTFNDAFSSSSELLDVLDQTESQHAISSETTLKRIDDDSDVHVNFNVAPLNDRFGNASGRMLRFSDVSDYHEIREQLNLHERMTELLAETQPETNYSNPNSYPREMIGASASMQEVFSLIEKISPSSASVLIYGESGTGKELIARSIHHRSNFSSKKFVAVNCGAIPENLIESEFFGHKKGAFTGAVSDNIGLFKEAEGGTLFLDEVGELPAHLQTKLLRALQEKVIRPVGDTRDVPINVRVVAATNRDLKEDIKTGQFREDLYYRLNVLSINLPPLRARREDIPLLVKHFINASLDDDSSENGAKISPEALNLLVNYNFPGNIRELENIIARALVLGGNAILPSHLPEELVNYKGYTGFNERSKSANGATSADIELPLDLDKELAELERKLLVKALEASNGVKKKAANLLGVNFRSFRYRLKKYGLQENE